jgi:Na+/H+-dicarboxylate symporter
VVFQFAKIVVGFAPYGVFALIACVVGHYGVAALLPLIKFVGAVYLSCALLIIFVYGGILSLNRINPIYFLKNVSTAFITAFTTSSSAATLPVTMRSARENLKINRSISDFLLPLGATLNLNGLAIYLSVAVIFGANLCGISLQLPQYISLIITIVFTCAGAAAIPGSALIVMSAVLSSVGIPLTVMPIIAGVDRFNDMAQTMTNVAGDLFATTLVAKSEKMIDLEPLGKSVLPNISPSRELL